MIKNRSKNQVKQPSQMTDADIDGRLGEIDERRSLWTKRSTNITKACSLIGMAGLIAFGTGFSGAATVITPFLLMSGGAAAFTLYACIMWGNDRLDIRLEKSWAAEKSPLNEEKAKRTRQKKLENDPAYLAEMAARKKKERAATTQRAFNEGLKAPLKVKRPIHFKQRPVAP